MRSLVLLCCLPLLASARTLLGSSQPCWDRTRELKAAGQTAGLPACDRLGRYSPQQCSDAECYCADPSGQRLTDAEQKAYTVQPAEKDRQACRCARVKYEVAQSGTVGVITTCDERGDYHHTQCIGSVCHCVNTHSGEKREEPHLSAHVASYAELTEKCQQAAAQQQQ